MAAFDPRAAAAQLSTGRYAELVVDLRRYGNDDPDPPYYLTVSRPGEDCHVAAYYSTDTGYLDDVELVALAHRLVHELRSFGVWATRGELLREVAARQGEGDPG